METEGHLNRAQVLAIKGALEHHGVHCFATDAMTALWVAPCNGRKTRKVDTEERAVTMLVEEFGFLRDVGDALRGLE